MGVLVRDSISGVGTVTFIKEDGKFGALGHPVYEKDRNLLKISGGNCFDCGIIGVNRGERGMPGELKGAFLSSQSIAEIKANEDKIAEIEAKIVEFMNGINAKLEEAKTTEEQGYGAFVTIHEGKFHQVKRMFLARDNKVLYLKRIKIGDVWLDKSLEKGQYREMTQQEKDSIITDKGERLQ